MNDRHQPCERHLYARDSGLKPDVSVSNSGHALNMSIMSKRDTIVAAHSSLQGERPRLAALKKQMDPIRTLQLISAQHLEHSNRGSIVK